MLAERAKVAYWAKSADERKALRTNRADYLRKWNEDHKEQIAEKSKAWRAANKPAEAAKSRASYLAHRAARIERAREWALANPDKVRKTQNAAKARYAADPVYTAKQRARQREWAKSHPEQLRENSKRQYARVSSQPGYREGAATRKKQWDADNRDRVRQYNIDNADRIREHAAKWRKENPEAYLAAAATQRARRKNSVGFFTENDIALLFDAQIGLCAGCRKDLKDGYEIDHVMPLFLLGSNWPDNLQLLCRTCNRMKGHSHPDVWAERIGKLFA